MQLEYSEKTRQPEMESTNKINYPDIMLDPRQQEDGKESDKDFWKKIRKETKYTKID